MGKKERVQMVCEKCHKPYSVLKQFAWIRYGGVRLCGVCRREDPDTNYKLAGFVRK